MVSGVYTGASSGASLGSGNVRSYATFTDIKEGYRIRGMISTMVGPLTKNTPQAREVLAREAAAGLGADSLVGLTSIPEPYFNYSKYARSCAILVNTGVEPSENQPARPRFIVCILPVRVKTDKTKPASRLEPYIFPELQFHLAQKGYYTYRCNSTLEDVTGLAADKEIPAELREPLGVVPDFVLTCEIEEGRDTVGLSMFKTLRMRVALYDLQQKRTLWEDAQSMAGWGLLDKLADPNGGGWIFSKGRLRDGVHNAVDAAAEELSPVSGFGKLKK